MAVRTNKIDPERLYRCVEPLSFVDHEGVPQALTRETVLKGSHEIVQRFAMYFAEEGDPQAQAAARAALVDPDEQRAIHRMNRQSDIRILEGCYRALRSVRLDVDGQERRVKKGELLDPSELIVSLIPNAFERVSVKVKR
jgi:hypothetical protein